MKIIQSNLKYTRWFGTRTLAQIRFIVIHHIQHPNASIYDIDRWHKANNWGGAGYQFYIRKNGSIYTGRRVKEIGTAVAGNNTITLNVALEGDFRTEQHTQKQEDSLIELIDFLQLQLPAPVPIVGHNHFGGTECPAGFNVKAFVSRMNEKAKEKTEEEKREEEKERAIEDIRERIKASVNSIESKKRELKELQEVIETEERDSRYLEAVLKLVKNNIIRTHEFWTDIEFNTVTRDIMIHLVANVLEDKNERKIERNEDVFKIAENENIINSAAYWEINDNKKTEWVKIFVINLAKLYS